MSSVKAALAPDEVKSHARPDRRLMVRLASYVRPYWKIALVTLVLSLLAGALRIVQPLLAKRIIDVEIAGRDVQGVVRLSLVLLAIILVLLVVEIAFGYLTAWVGQRSMHDLRRRLFRRVLAQDVAFFDRNPIGRLITRLTSDVGTLNELFASGVVQILGEMLVLVAVLGLMLYYNVKLTGVVLLSAPLLLLVMTLFRRHVRRWYLETRRTLATMNAYLQENITGMRTVQSFNRESRNLDQFRDLNDEYRFANIQTISAFALFFPAVSLISSLAVAGVVWVGGHDLIAQRGRPDPSVTFGEIFLFVQCVTMLFQPIRVLSEKFNLLQSAMASSERIFHLLDSEAKVQQPADPIPLDGFHDAVRFEDVHFAYNVGEPVLKGVSFEIPKGRTVAVVGATGAGKSTLINLITRMYDVTGGRVTVDGIDVRELDLRRLRGIFTVVLQEVFLFSGTIADNLRLANENLSDAELWEILRQANLHDFVATLPGGLQARVTERGGTFSTGQKQLFSLARALAADPEFLILDEATANIDTETEFRIQEATSRMLAGRTALVIAHRLSTIQRADRIIVMHHGQIHETGTHEELIAGDGLYRRLYELQYRSAAVAG